MTIAMTLVINDNSNDSSNDNSNDNTNDSSHGFIINNHDDGFIAIYSMIMTTVLICTQ